MNRIEHVEQIAKKHPFFSTLEELQSDFEDYLLAEAMNFTILAVKRDLEDKESM